MRFRLPSDSSPQRLKTPQDAVATMPGCVRRLRCAGRARSCGRRCASAAVGKLAHRCAHMHSSNPTLGVQCRLTHLTRNERPAQRRRQRAAAWIVGDDLVLVIVWPHLILRPRLAAATTAWAHPWTSTHTFPAASSPAASAGAPQASTGHRREVENLPSLTGQPPVSARPSEPVQLWYAPLALQTDFDCACVVSAPGR